MRTKAIRDLEKLPSENFFEEIANGLDIIAENTKQIYLQASQLAEHKSFRGYRILRNFAEEEAAKFLILLDAVRCPRNAQAEFFRQLQYFYSHLAKGIYIDYCEIKPINFEEVQKWIENQRPTLYLDGPNDVDWIFRNWILQRREDAIYVDYVEADNTHYWSSPAHYDSQSSSIGMNIEPNVIKLVSAMHRLGFTKMDTQKIIASKWQPVTMASGFTWKQLQDLNIETLAELECNQLITTEYSKDHTTIIELWLFPLYSLNLNPIEVNESKLREEQENWSPY